MITPVLLAGCGREPPAAAPKNQWASLESACLTDENGCAALRGVYERACADGDSAACAELGTLWETGRGGPIDAARARALYAVACDHGVMAGCTDLAWLKDLGIGGSTDKAEARALVERACGEEFAEGCFALAEMWAMGDGVPRDREKAGALFRRARPWAEAGCSRGVVRDCNELGLAFLIGLGGAKDLDRARSLFDDACRHGLAGACFRLGWIWEDGLVGVPDPAKARELYQKACRRGNARGCTTLGLMWADGRGGATNPQKSRRLYQRGCDLGDGRACRLLATMWGSGEGAPPDEAKARALLDRACELKEVDGCSSLATRAETGVNELFDPVVASDAGRRARTLLDQRCRNGAEGACSALAELLEGGAGVPVELGRARNLYQKLCADGDTAACHNADALKPAPATGTLWDLAPPGASWGVVLEPEGTGALSGLVPAIVRVLSRRGSFAKYLMAFAALGAPLVRPVMAGPDGWREVGLDPERGMAVFWGDVPHHVLVVLPVADREAFRRQAGVTTVTVDGTLYERVASLLCRPVGPRYLCASGRNLLAAAERPHPGRFAAAFAVVPVSVRGPILELTLQSAQDAGRPLSGLVAGATVTAVSARFGNGDLTLRGWADAGGDWIGHSVFRARNRAATARVSASRPAALIRWDLPLDLAGQKIGQGPREVVDALESLTGEVVAYVPCAEAPWGRIEVASTKPKLLEPVVARACEWAAGQPYFEGVTGKSSVCVGRVRNEAMAGAPFAGSLASEKVPFRLETDRRGLRATLGAPPQKPSKAPPLSPTARELLSGDWGLVVWGRGLGDVPPWGFSGGGIQSEIPWVLAHIAEVGLGITARDDGTYVLLHVGTYAADPPEVLRAYQDAVNQLLDGGADTAAAARKALARKYPESRAGQRERIGIGGSMVVAMLGGMLYAVARPAFDRYVERTRGARSVTDADGQQKAPEPNGNEERSGCRLAVPHMIEIMKNDMEEVFADLPPEQADRFRGEMMRKLSEDDLLRECLEKRFTQEQFECVMKAEVMDDLKKCVKK